MPLLHAVPLGEGPGGEIADDDLQGHDGDPLHQRLPLAQFLHEVGGDAGLLQPPHQGIGHLIVDDALARNGTLFQAIEGSGVILVVHDIQLRIIGFVDLLGLALIDLFQLLHWKIPLVFS